MPPIFDQPWASPERRVGRPRHQMCGAGAYFVVTAGTAVRLDRTVRGDGTDFVLVAVGPDLHPARRQGRQ